jgi:hypothetical protein
MYQWNEKMDTEYEMLLEIEKERKLKYLNYLNDLKN